MNPSQQTGDSREKDQKKTSRASTRQQALEGFKQRSFSWLLYIAHLSFFSHVIFIFKRTVLSRWQQSYYVRDNNCRRLRYKAFHQIRLFLVFLWFVGFLYNASIGLMYKLFIRNVAFFFKRKKTPRIVNPRGWKL